MGLTAHLWTVGPGVCHCGGHLGLTAHLGTVRDGLHFHGMLTDQRQNWAN